MKFRWIGLSFVSLFMFSFMYFLITFLTRKGISVSLVMFGVSCSFILFFFTQLILSKDFQTQITPSLLLLLLVIGIFSAIGNWAQFQAANDAPNPGIAISIINLFVIPTTILAAIFFKDRVKPLQVLGIVISLIGIGMVTIGELPTFRKPFVPIKQVKMK